MYSFYGGQKGQDFKITRIFQNRSYDLLEDLKARWYSPVNVGDYVFISYGDASKSGVYWNKDGNVLSEDFIANLGNINNEDQSVFEKNLDVDLTAIGRSFNNSIWQKIYIDENYQISPDLPESDNNIYVYLDFTGNDYSLLECSDILAEKYYGFAYRLIACVTGQTPRIKVFYERMNLEDSDAPFVAYDVRNPDTPKLKFYLPKAQEIQGTQCEKISNKEEPSVELLTDGEYYGKAITKTYPVLDFKLPDAPHFYTGILFNKGDLIINNALENKNLQSFWQYQQYYEVQESITITKSTVDDAFDIADTILKYGFLYKQINEENEEYFILSGSNENNESLLAKLNASSYQTIFSNLFIQEPYLDIYKIYSSLNDLGSYTFESKNEYILFKNLLISNKVEQSTFENLRAGDIYVSHPSGRTYLIESINSNEDGETLEVHALYEGCIKAPVPEAITELIPAYTSIEDEQGNTIYSSNEISVKSNIQIDDTTNALREQYIFSIPQKADLEFSINPVSSQTIPSVGNKQPKQDGENWKDNYTLNLPVAQHIYVQDGVEPNSINGGLYFSNNLNLCNLSSISYNNEIIWNPNDLFIYSVQNTSDPNNGQIWIYKGTEIGHPYKLDNNEEEYIFNNDDFSLWEKYSNISGPVGIPKFKSQIDIRNLGESTIEDYLNALTDVDYPSAENGELSLVNVYNEDNVSYVSYWANRDNSGTWYLTAVSNSYSLINDNELSEDKDDKGITYSRNKIDSLLSEIIGNSASSDIYSLATAKQAIETNIEDIKDIKDCLRWHDYEEDAELVE